GHALTKTPDDLSTPILFFEPAHVSAVHAVGEIQRHCRHRQDLPHAVIDHLNELHSEAGPDEGARTAAENTFRPRSSDRLSREERPDELRRSALDQAVSDDRRGDWYTLPRPYEVAERATERPVGEARDLCRDHGRRAGREHPAGWMWAL